MLPEAVKFNIQSLHPETAEVNAEIETEISNVADVEPTADQPVEPTESGTNSENQTSEGSESTTEGESKWVTLAEKDLFEGKNVVIFGLPGAFTPTCSTQQLPGYEDKYDELATSDDGSCDRLGCTSDWADNYDDLATTDDSSCELNACMSDWADNYNLNATTDEGRCDRLGCMSEWAYNYET